MFVKINFLKAKQLNLHFEQTKEDYVQNARDKPKTSKTTKRTEKKQVVTHQNEGPKTPKAPATTTTTPAAATTAAATAATATPTPTPTPTTTTSH